jgi:effector-binding domain-containing protein
MSDRPKPTEPVRVATTSQTTAVIRGQVPVTELATFFDRSFGALGEALAQQDVEIAGPAFARYEGPPGETAVLEVGFPTRGVVEPVGEIVASSLPEGEVARAVHHGSYDDLGESWARVQAWMGERGLAPSPVLWEVYVTEPSPEMDPNDLRTELNWLI